MICPRCKSEVKDMNKYCSNCGMMLSEPSKFYVHAEEYKKIDGDEHGDLEATLTDVYIGANKDAIKRGGFSFNAFLFGPHYYLYRKMYLEAFIYYIVFLIVSLLEGPLTVLELCILLYCGFTFKRHYNRHVKKKVEKMIRNNPTKNRDELFMMAYQKGGTSIGPIIVLGAISFLLVFLSIVIFVTVIGEKFMEQESGTKDNINYITYLHYDIPENFYIDEEYNTDYFVSYKTEDNHCAFYISSTKENIYEYDVNENTGLEQMSLVLDGDNDVIDFEESTTINGNVWDVRLESSSVSKTYTLTTYKDNTNYKVSFFYIDDEEHAYCADAYLNLINSLEIR